MLVEEGDKETEEYGDRTIPRRWWRTYTWGGILSRSYSLWAWQFSSPPPPLLLLFWCETLWANSRQFRTACTMEQLLMDMKMFTNSLLGEHLSKKGWVVFQSWFPLKNLNPEITAWTCFLKEPAKLVKSFLVLSAFCPVLSFLPITCGFIQSLTFCLDSSHNSFKRECNRSCTLIVHCKTYSWCHLMECPFYFQRRVSRIDIYMYAPSNQANNCTAILPKFALSDVGKCFRMLGSLSE